MNSADPVSAMEHFSSFQLFVLVFQPANSALINLVFRHNRQLFSAKTSSEQPNVRYLPNTKQDTDKISNHLMNKVEQLAAKKLDISPRSWQRSKQS